MIRSAQFVVAITILSVVVWLVCVCLLFAIDRSTQFLFAHTGGSFTLRGALTIVIALFAGAFIRSLLLRDVRWHSAIENSVDKAVSNYRLASQQGVPARIEKKSFSFAARKFIMTFLSIGSGGAGGLVAPTLAMTESLGAGVAKLFGVAHEFRLRAFQLSAVAAGITTLFHAPFTGALFATEVMHRNKLLYRYLHVCLLAAAIAYTLNFVFGLEPAQFVLDTEFSGHHFNDYVLTILVSMLVSMPVALSFIFSTRQVAAGLSSFSLTQRAYMGSALISLLAISFWFFFDVKPSYILGLGRDTAGTEYFIESAALGVPWFLILVVVGRMFTTALSSAGAGSVGLFLPSALLGGLTGGITTLMINHIQLIGSFDPVLPVVAGICAAIVAVIRVPLAAIALVIEIFGFEYTPIAVLSSAIAFLVTQKLSVYKTL